MRSPERRRRETSLERRYLNFLAEVGRILGESLPYETTLQRVCDAAVSTVADTATMYLCGDDGKLDVVAAAHAVPERSEEVRVRASAMLQDAEGPHALLESVIGKGSGVLVTPTLIVVPLVAPQGEKLGALSLVYTDESGLHYDDDALILAEDLASRCAAAIAKAKLHETAIDVSTRFQLEALPKTLPAIANLQLDSFYEPASSALLVGGDWFDAFMVSGRKLGITIGDVSGHGVRAAAVMSNLRSALRIAMLMEQNLATVLAAADLLIRQELGSSMFATANIGVLDLDARRLSCVAAGHPGPLCWNEANRTVDDPFLDRGLPLGFRNLTESRNDVQTVDLQDGSFIVFFTDGLLEAERDYLTGEQSLIAAIAQQSIREANHPARAIRNAVVSDGHPDDLAVLTLRIKS